MYDLKDAPPIDRVIPFEGVESKYSTFYKCKNCFYEEDHFVHCPRDSKNNCLCDILGGYYPKDGLLIDIEEDYELD
jgi:hypothetical protein